MQHFEELKQNPNEANLFKWRIAEDKQEAKHNYVVAHHDHWEQAKEQAKVLEIKYHMHAKELKYHDTMTEL